MEQIYLVLSRSGIPDPPCFSQIIGILSGYSFLILSESSFRFSIAFRKGTLIYQMASAVRETSFSNLFNYMQISLF